MTILENLVDFSKRYGSRPDLVLAGGGNTSAKEDGVLYIKGSGVSLAEITADGIVKMDRQRLDAMFSAQYPQEDTQREAAVLADLMAARCEGEQHKRPSVETLLHAMFPQRYVLHVHPALVNGLTCSRGGEARARELLPRDFIWVDECKPGYLLSRSCAKAMQRYQEEKGAAANLLLLQNHGIFFAAEDVQELEGMLQAVMTALQGAVTRQPNVEQTGETDDQKEIGLALCALFEEPMAYRLCAGSDVLHFCSGIQQAAALMQPFTPDHIVYCKANPLYVDEPRKASRLMQAYSLLHAYAPRVFLVEGVGAYCLGASEKQAETCRALFLDAVTIAVYAQSFGGCRHMSRAMTDFIVNWEVESYRARLSN